MVAGDNDNKSENGNGANTEATVKARSLNNADKVGKRSGGVMEEHKRRRKTARQVIRHTRSSSRLTSNEQLSPQDPVLSCKSQPRTRVPHALAYTLPFPIR